MQLSFKPFESFITNYTTQASRSRYADSTILEIEISDHQIVSKVKGSRIYFVRVDFTRVKVLNAVCSCLYDQAGYCKHIIHTIVHADKLISGNHTEEKNGNEPPLKLRKEKSRFVIADQHIPRLTERSIRTISQGLPKINPWHGRMDIRKARLSANSVVAEVHQGYNDEWSVEISQSDEGIALCCNCHNPTSVLCPHLHFTLSEILSDQLLQLPFNEEKRHTLLREKAKEAGITAVQNPDDLFEINFSYGRMQITPKYSLLSLNDFEKKKLEKLLVPEFRFPKTATTEKKEFLLAQKSEYSNEITFQLVEAPLSKSGAIKSPIDGIAVREKMRLTTDKEELLFYSALIRQSEHFKETALIQDIIKNPLNIPFYYHETGWDTKKVIPKNIHPVTVKAGNPNAVISVRQSGEFYVLNCEITIDNKHFQSKNVHLTGSFFISGSVLYFINNEIVTGVLSFFKNQNHEVYIHRSQFTVFKEDFLDKLEQSVTVFYSFVKKAPAKVVKERSLDTITDHLIYLSESEDFILITPVICYGEIEVPVLSKRTIYTENPDGTLYSIKRNESAERHFLRSIQVQHPSFESFPETAFYYLHKQEFLEEGWFVDAFEEWRKNGYAILGFNQLKNNRYNPHKVKILTKVNSGIDWFEVKTSISFGSQEVGLKEIQKSIINKTRFVRLGDGTQGLMPREWIEKFSHYFRSGELKEDSIRIHKSNFQLIDKLFEEDALSEETRTEVTAYRTKLAEFHSIKNVQVPKQLRTTLRDYQKEGLNWLNFLDEFGFGGCLADDMGLGKTVQIIAYFLSQHEKGNTQPNLVVIPTSLLFNWQAEIDKFAPHLSCLSLYGANRDTGNTDFKKYDVILTTYGTLLSDIEILRKQVFNIIVLDESQAIKNPESKRYKSVRLLQGRQRLVVTGTPVENNTFDLYAQLSFTMPGLLGSAKRFTTDYSNPIDKFQDTLRAQELQQKIHPFVLRRTKKQVAKELPEKTEMVIYCEMGTEQRRIYDTYKTEFQKYLSGLSDDELSSSSLHVLQGLTKLRQICNSPALLSDDEFYGDQSAKMEELMIQINNLKNHHKIIVFSQFVGMLDLVRQRLNRESISHAYLTGQTKKREEQVELFQNDDTIRVFLISLKAGGTGLNLTKAEYVFLIDPWWNPAVENQAIDRAHRIGQQNKVVAIRLITPSTIEEKIMELQQRKRQLAEDLVHTDTNILKQLSKEDLMGLI